MAAVAPPPAPIAPAHIDEPVHIDEPAHVDPPVAVNGAPVDTLPIKAAVIEPPPASVPASVPAAAAAPATLDWSSASAAKEIPNLTGDVAAEHLNYDPAAEHLVNGTVFGLISFGTWLKRTLDDIYARIKVLQNADPTLVKIQLDLQNYNRVVRTYNGSVKEVNEPLRPLFKLVQDAKKQWIGVPINGMPRNISEVNNLQGKRLNELLVELGVDSARKPGGRDRKDFIHVDEGNRRRQARIALGLTPWPINLNIY